MEKFIVGKFNTNDGEEIFQQVGEEGPNFEEVCLRARDLQVAELGKHISYYGLHIRLVDGKLKVQRGLRYMSMHESVRELKPVA